MAADQERVRAGDRTIAMSNLDKVLYPETGTTKRDVLRYYASVADVIIEEAAGRPLTVRRWVRGVGTTSAPTAGFFQKDLGSTAPSWVSTVVLPHSDHESSYPLIDGPATLAWLVQLDTLELHTPQWRIGRDRLPRNPDRLVIDLDPGPGVGLPECAELADTIRGDLAREGLDARPVTSGSKGIHLYVPLDGSRTSEEVSGMARDLAQRLERTEPGRVTSRMTKRNRVGRVLVDWSQNSRSKTTITPYSLRGRHRPTVAVPRTWSELAAPGLRHLELPEVLERVATARGLARPLRFEEDPHFTIHQHRARRVHLDLAIGDGQPNAAWALPAGMPEHPGESVVAVATEACAELNGLVHRPRETHELLESGRATVHAWRAGEVAIVTLEEGEGHGHRARTVALTHVGRPGADDDHWSLRDLRRREGEPSNRIPVRPMLAMPAEELPGGDWCLEMKWDGVRIIADVAPAGVRLWSRNGQDATASFRELATEVARAVGDRTCVLDGEVVVLDERGRPSFELLQPYLGRSERLGSGAGARAVARHGTPSVILFDLLRLDGRSIENLTYDERRRMLEELVRPGPRVQAPPCFDLDLPAALGISREHGLEGVVAKRRGSPYRSGRRSADWLKIKHRTTADVLVAGWIGGAMVRSLVLAVPGPSGELQYAGRVGSGLSSEVADELLALLSPIRRDSPVVQGVPRDTAREATWVQPVLVVEVQFTEWTAAGRLRHPVWRGIRRDMSVGDVQRLTP